MWYCYLPCAAETCGHLSLDLFAEVKRKLGKKQKRRRFRGQINETTPKMA
jgi:hypothetical protein